MEEMTRRDFLKKGATVVGAALLASATSGCKGSNDEQSTNAFEFPPFHENENFKQNADMLNAQFENRKNEFLDSQGNFDYDRFEEVKKYEGDIENMANRLGIKFGLDPNVLKALTSIVISSYARDNMNVGSGVGVMRLDPNRVIPFANSLYSKEYTKRDVEVNNIAFGMIYLSSKLAYLRYNEQNTDLMDLMLKSYDSRIDYKPELASDVWSKVKEQWKSSRFEQNERVFFYLADKYANDEDCKKFGLSREQYLALFVSIAVAESGGGVNLINSGSGAMGWYQMIPRWQHLERYNQEHNTNYKYEDLISNDEISIKTGVWSLMQYKDRPDRFPTIYSLMKFFKAGGNFAKPGENHYAEDLLWWERVGNNLEYLLGENDQLVKGMNR